MKNINYSFPRILALLAAVWSLGVGLYILATPLSILETTAEYEAAAPGITETAERQVSWFEVQGWWGVVILLVFVLLYGSTAFFTWRSLNSLAFAGGGLSILLTYLAGFSIGSFYFPAAGMLLLGAVGSMVLRLRRSV